MPFAMSPVDLEICDMLKDAGYIKSVKIMQTLQGSVWRSVQTKTNKQVVIKVTDRYLHKNHIAITDSRKVKVHENIKKEISILKHLSQDKQCPNSIAKYIDAFKNKLYYVLVMEDGGRNLFSFVLKAHGFIAQGVLDITEWHKTVKIIVKQMIESIEYIHSKRVCHFDISLENFLINFDVEIEICDDNKIRFCPDSVQIRLCDFGLSETFRIYSNYKTGKYCGKPTYQSPEIRRQKRFSAKSNDIWCLGICFFMMIIGSSPWTVAAPSDVRFRKIMRGDIVDVLASWDKLCYTNDKIMDMFGRFFQFEDKRVSMNELKEYEWFRS